MAHAPATKKRTAHEDEEDVEEDDSSMLPPPPDGGWGWVVVFASFMIHIVTDGVTYSFGVFYVEFLNYFGESKGSTAWIASILVGVTLCSGPISSSFVNKYGCRAVTIAGAILASACMALSIFAQNVTTLYFTIGIGTGLGFGLIYLPAIVSVTCWFEKYRSLATGIAVCGSGLGTFIFAPLTEHLVREYGWRGSLLIISGLVLNCIIMGALFRPVPVPTVKVVEVPCSQPVKVDLGDVSENNHQLLALIPPGGKVALKRPQSLVDFPPPPKNAHSTHRMVDAGGRPTSTGWAPSQPGLVSSGPSHDHSQGLQPNTGSLRNIPNIYQRSTQRLQQDANVPEEGQLMESSSTRISNVHIYKSTTVVKHHHDRVKMCGCVPYSRETRDTLDVMLNFSLLKEPIFAIFAASNALRNIGFNIPYVYIVVQAEEEGISKEHASYLLAIIGIANTVGRIVLGYISDKPWINRLMVHNVCLMICGLATLFSAFCSGFTSFAIYAVVFGFTVSASVCLTSVILVDLFGLEKLSTAFGIILLSQGLTCLIGPPIAGWLYDVYESYDPGFYVAGTAIVVSTALLFFIPPLQRHHARRQHSLSSSGMASVHATR